ncbi:hypothetical protein [Kineosporia sp. NBRC 101731]|uniref:hypothetical protein n=1 Tax=Kineosporia sp. NBRC 101731 TaxID=3032199 RepID=UPI002552D970|nr:hypothetical protein [Kineosporia sp. NBRC 101731]
MAANNDDRPATLAEGYPVAVEVPNLPDGTTVAGAPTVDDYAREWGTYRARVPLTVDGARAVAQNGPVPTSHPMVPQWLEDGLLERVDGQAPAQVPANAPAPAEKPLPTRPAGRERDA